MEKTPNWTGQYIPQSDKEDIIRAEFVLKGWTRTPEGNMTKGNLMLVFVFNKVRLKKRTPQGWKLLNEGSLEQLYQKLR